MKKLKYMISDLGLMIRPFWQYDKACIIIQTIWNCISSPLVSLLYIWMTQTIIDQIARGESWQIVLGSVAFFSMITLLQNLIGDAMWKFYITPHMERVKAQIETDVFQTLKKTDFNILTRRRFMMNLP